MSEHPSRTSPDRYGAYLEPARRWAHAILDPLPTLPREFLIFGFKQAWACLFGGLMLGAILVTKFIWHADWHLARYDFLFVYAIAIQLIFLALKLERLDEAKVILIFHVVGTIMELFKTDVGSWHYPESSLLHIGGVPLFSGFMYSCIGSYIARSNRIMDLHYERFPPFWSALLLSALIYANFFTHHYIPDMRIGLFVLTVVLFGRTMVRFTVDRVPRVMPLVVAFFLIALFIWFAEFISSASATWSYTGSGIVSLGKLGSWYLLMIVSFVLVALVHRPRTAPVMPKADDHAASGMKLAP